MNLESKMIKNIVTILVVLIVASVITFVGYHSLGRKAVTKSDNPYEFDIEAFRQVPAELIRYTQIRQIQVNLTKLHALAIAPGNRILVCGDNSVQQYTNNGTLLRSFTLAGAAQCVAVDTHFNIYIGIGNHIEVYDTSGALLQHWPPYNENSYITSLAILQNNIFAADAGKQLILHYDNNGNFLNKIGEKDAAKDIPGFIIPSLYFDVAVDPDGFIWAANTGRQSMENYTPAGELRSHWGSSSMRIEGFSGCCNPSHFALMSDGSFVTAEKGLERVKVYDRAGQFVAVVAPPTLFTPGTTGLDVAVDSNDDIYVLDPAAGVVRVFQHNNLNAGAL